MTDVEFKAWPKTKRLKSFEVTITEKIDGTNACVIVQDGELVGCQSRNRLIKPGDDNMGFAFWAFENRHSLAALGDGYHYGEWAGPGIQKNPHELPEKRFYLFNTFRPVDSLPTSVYQVPILYQGAYDEDRVAATIDSLSVRSVIGGKAEGIILYFHSFRQSMKWTFEYQDGKWTGVK